MPRSARLAAWGTAVLQGRAPPADAVRAVTGTDEPHLVDGPDGVLDGGLAELLAGFLERGVAGLLVVLPAPGDVSGLPGPAAFNQDAVAAGECVLAAGDARALGAGAGTGIVPSLEVFGSPWELGCLVTWTVQETLPRRVTDAASLAEADRALREALAEAVDTLVSLDLARWREDAADRITAVRAGSLAPGSLPPGTASRAAQVLASAARVRAIVDLAVEDDGAALSGHEARRRAEALRGLDAVARRGMVAAVNAALEPR